MARGKRSGRPGLWYRVGSAFENGYGDEGFLAKVIHGVIVVVLIVVSSVLGVLIAPFWYGNKLFGHKGGQDGSQSSSDSTTS